LHELADTRSVCFACGAYNTWISVVSKPCVINLGHIDTINPTLVIRPCDATHRISWSDPWAAKRHWLRPVSAKVFASSRALHTLIE